MYHYRVTKYDPERRSPDGKFLDEDWTSYSDVGSSFGGLELDEGTYRRTESFYARSAREFLEESGCSELRIVALENHGDFQSSLNLQAPLSGNDIEQAVAEVLRELWWAKFEADNGYIHIGWDFYMYVGVATECPVSIARAKARGLYVEPYESPYLG